MTFVMQDSELVFPRAGQTFTYRLSHVFRADRIEGRRSFLLTYQAAIAGNAGRAG
jgi:hypothetical protein